MSSEFTTAVTALVYVLAVARIVRLINYDAIFDRPRIAIVKMVRGNPMVVYFLTCPWCVGMWACLATVWLPVYFSDNLLVGYVGLALAASMVIGLASPLSADDEIEIEDDSDDNDG